MRIALAGPVRFDEVAGLLDGAVPDPARAISGGSPVSALARALHSRGHEVAVATLAYDLARPVTVTGPQFELHLAPNRSQHRARDVFAVERRALEDALTAIAPDVVHAHWTYEFALAALAVDTPAIVTVRDWAPTILRHHRHPYRVVRLGMAVAVLRRAPVLTVTSPYMLERVRRWAPGDVHLVPNAIADEDFLSVPPARERRDAPVVVAINNGWGERKNVAALLEAFPSVRRRVPGARLCLVGTGYEVDGPAHLFARRRGLDAGVTFVGALPYREAMRTLADADLFVHPSREESFGLVLVEAMARGVPVVAGEASGAVPWVCDDGRAAELTEVGDAGALADAVATVLLDGAHAERLRTHAHRWARERFSMSAVVDAYERLYGDARRRSP